MAEGIFPIFFSSVKNVEQLKQLLPSKKKNLTTGHGYDDDIPVFTLENILQLLFSVFITYNLQS